MTEKLPEIGVVIIGINVERYLADCLNSIYAADYPRELISVVYVDGGSRDDSVRLANDYYGVKLIELNDPHPTPGRGRNAGWRSLDTPLIQFLDADTVMDPMWFKRALPLLSSRTAAVTGHRRERYPDKNIFHMLTEMEWHYEIGLCRYFGGDVLISREALEKTGGFDDDLVAGEDPELSYRVRQEDWDIVRMDTLMTTHDINMSRFSQYFKRAYRSGHAYAEIALRFMFNGEKLWLRELARIAMKTLLPPVFVVLGILTGNGLAGLLIGLLILFRPLFSVQTYRKTSNQFGGKTLIYALHSAFVIYPQFLGVLRYFYGRISGNRLMNKGFGAK